MTKRPPREQMPLQEWHRWWKHFGQPPLRHMMLLYWDPIGVYGVSEAMDEYDSYAAKVGAMLGDGASRKDIERYLRDIAVDRMGIGAPRSGDVSKRIYEWFEDSLSAYLRELKQSGMLDDG